jgi:hypothetical protein
MDVDRTAVAGARAIVLVEGMSDKAALETLAPRLGIPTGGTGIHIVPMGGVTNIGRFIDTFGPAGLKLTVTGLCDAGEADYVRRVLARAGYLIGQSRGDLAGAGFYVCDADLEDELIRAVGVDGVERVIEAQGELGSYQTFGKQPAQRRRSTEQHLHRFMGTRSGRKSLYASLLAAALDLDRIPDPLLQVLTHAAGRPAPAGPPHPARS